MIDGFPQPDNNCQRMWRRVRESPIAWRLFHGTFWSIAGAVVPRLLELVLAMVIARGLGQVGFGEYSSVLNTVLTFAVVASLGLGVTATGQIAARRESGTKPTSQVLTFVMTAGWSSGILFGIVFWVVAPWIGSVFLDSPDMGRLLRICAPWLTFTVASGILGSVLVRFEEFRLLAVLNTVAYVVLFAAVGRMAVYFNRKTTPLLAKKGVKPA